MRRPVNSPEQAQPAAPTTQPFTPIDQHLFDARIVFVSGEVNGDLALRVNRQLLAMEKVDPARPVLLWIDSPGGEMFSGYSIYDTARFIQPRVVTLVAGFAASMASVIALAAEKKDRLAFPTGGFGGAVKGAGIGAAIGAAAAAGAMAATWDPPPFYPGWKPPAAAPTSCTTQDQPDNPIGKKLDPDCWLLAAQCRARGRSVAFCIMVRIICEFGIG